MIAKKSVTAALTVGGIILAGWAIWKSGDSEALARKSHITQPNRETTISRAEHFRPETFLISFGKITGEADEIERDHQLQNLADSVPRSDLAKAVAAIDIENQTELEHDLWLRLLRRWGGSEPRDAAVWAEALSQIEKRKEAMALVAIAWANADLTAAENWVSGWPQGAERDSALTAVTYEGARTDPEAALQFTAGFPPTQENENLIVYSISQWSTTEPAAAWEWAQQIEDPESRAMLESNVVVTWAAQDPVAASQRVPRIAPGRSQDDAVIGVAQHWVQRDPAATKQWITRSSPNIEIRDTALHAINAILNSSR